MLCVAVWYDSILPVVMRVKEELQFFLHPHNLSRHTKSQHTTQERSWRWTIEVRNMLSYWMLWIKLTIKYCVSCWITDILQNDTRSIKYQISWTLSRLLTTNYIPNSAVESSVFLAGPEIKSWFVDSEFWWWLLVLKRGSYHFGSYLSQVIIYEWTPKWLGYMSGLVANRR